MRRIKLALIATFGFPILLIYADPTTLDRWFWLRKRLPRTITGKKLIDVGCGTGVFTVYAALRGYQSLGLSWDDWSNQLARERAYQCRAQSAKFEKQDVRVLSQRRDLVAQFDVAICLETIEHILDDRKLMRDIAACLKPEGVLLLTTPNHDHIPISKGTRNIALVEDGRHVRKGYTEDCLIELCETAGLTVNAVSFCTGFLSQKITSLQRLFSRVHPLFGKLIILPLRIFPPLFDPVVTKLLRWPQYSICIEAHKPLTES